MISPAQRTMLFSMFNRACQAANLTGSIARDQYREQLTIKVCGSLISWNDLTNKQVDAIKGELLAILQPANLDAQLDQINQQRTRTLYSIRRFPDQYVAKIAQSKFGKTDLADLTERQLRQLAMTLGNRARAESKKSKVPF